MILPSETESKFYFAASTRENTHDQQTGKHNICRGDHFRFGSVFTHKKQPNRKKKKKDPKLNRNRPKPTGFGSVSVRFLMPKTEKTYMHFFWAS